MLTINSAKAQRKNLSVSLAFRPIPPYTEFAAGKIFCGRKAAGSFAQAASKLLRCARAAFYCAKKSVLLSTSKGG